MDKALYVGNSMIVPVETLDLVLLQDIFKHPSSDREYDLRDFHGKLAKMLPEFRDESIPYRAWRPEIRECGTGVKLHTPLHYVVPLQKGRIEVEMLLAQDLGAYCSERVGYDFRLILGEKKGEPIRESLSGKSGVVVKGQYRHGRGEEQGLYLGVYFDRRRRSPQGSLDNISDSITQRVLNALCESRPLNFQKELSDYSPLSFSGREVRANMKDLRLAALKEAEPHIDEFFSWISSQAQEIQTLLVMSNLYHKFAYWESKLQELQDSKMIKLKSMPNHTAQTLDIITSLMNNLHPPQNRMMEYLVNS